MTTRTEQRPQTISPAPQPDSRTHRAPTGGLSVAQVVGGSLAAATAAALGSRLGTVGTISGAALVSVVASVAGTFYTHSLRRTGDRVSTVLRSAPTGRRVLLGALLVFAVAAAAVTTTELVSGRSLAGSAGSTTVGRTVQGGQPSGSGHEPGSGAGSPADRTPAPTTDAEPSSTASPASGSSPTSHPVATPSTAPSGTPSGAASSTTAPQAEDTADPSPTGTADPAAAPTAGASGSPVTP
jgi:cell division septation protein DedD